MPRTWEVFLLLKNPSYDRPWIEVRSSSTDAPSPLATFLSTLLLIMWVFLTALLFFSIPKVSYWPDSLLTYLMVELLLCLFLLMSLTVRIDIIPRGLLTGLSSVEELQEINCCLWLTILMFLLLIVLDLTWYLGEKAVGFPIIPIFFENLVSIRPSFESSNLL